jgi:SPP1 family predicted phage head-tail adaptor
MRAGRLDRRITIQRSAHSVNEYGTPVFVWSDFATLRAQLVESKAEEFLAGGAANDKTLAIFRVRYLAGVTNADRITYDGKAFNIREVKEIGRRKGLELRAESDE